jgi:hypothetical protein
MKICVQTQDGTIIWERATYPCVGGFTANSYLRDGTQQKIIAALVDALAEARGQLSSLPLEIADVVADVGDAPAKVDCRVPLAVVWNRDAGR